MVEYSLALLKSSGLIVNTFSERLYKMAFKKIH